MCGPLGISVVDIIHGTRSLPAGQKRQGLLHIVRKQKGDIVFSLHLFCKLFWHRQMDASGNSRTLEAEQLPDGHWSLEWMSSSTKGNSGEKQHRDRNQRRRHLRGQECHTHTGHNSREPTQCCQWRFVCHSYQLNRISDRSRHGKAETGLSRVPLGLPLVLIHSFVCIHHTRAQMRHTLTTHTQNERELRIPGQRPGSLICKPKAFLSNTLVPFAKILCQQGEHQNFSLSGPITLWKGSVW